MELKEMVEEYYKAMNPAVFDEKAKFILNALNHLKNKLYHVSSIRKILVDIQQAKKTKYSRSKAFQELDFTSIDLIQEQIKIINIITDESKK
jgi:hypothetical protein